MTDKEKEMLYDLLVKRVTEGLNLEEQERLARFDDELVKAELRGFEQTAAAIGMASIEIEPMPEHLFAKVGAAAPATLKAKSAEFDGGSTIPAIAPTYTADDIFEKKPRSFIVGVLGWVTAAILLVVLGIQFYNGRVNQSQQPEKAAVTLPSPSAATEPDLAQQRDELLRTAPDVVSATWSPGNMKDMKVTGDIVWSDSKQQGYMRFRGLPANDAAKTCYQLWIFDKTQDEATPIDGGIFDANSNGDLIVPIHANLHAEKPQMFAVTVEKHGGVMVSKREKIAALAKVVTQTS
jgi:hypothetical protein